MSRLPGILSNRLRNGRKSEVEAMAIARDATDHPMREDACFLFADEGMSPWELMRLWREKKKGDGRVATMDTDPVRIEDDTASLDTATAQL